MTDTHNIWTDGSGEDYLVGGFEVAGAGMYLPAPEEALRGSVWRVAVEYGDARLQRCRAFMPVPGALQSVQRAELWGATVALQAYWPCHLGVDNVNVAWSTGRLLDHGCLAKPLPLVKDEDLVAIAQYTIQAREQDTVRVTKVEGHATERRTDSGMLRLILLLITAGVTSLSWPRMLGVLRSMLVIIGIPSFCSFIGSWFRCPGLLSIVMVGVVPPLIRLFGIKGVRGISVKLISGSTSILPLPRPPGFLNGPC